VKGVSVESAARGMTVPRYLLLASVLLLALGGLVMIYSASSVSDYVKLHDSAYHLKRQALWLLGGAVLAWAVSRIDYRAISSSRWFVYGGSLAGLVAVFFVGVEKYGGRRWLSIGPLVIQPSEYAKLGCLLLVAAWVVEWQRGRLATKDLYGRLCVVLAPVVVLVMLQPDMGTTLSILAAVFVVLVLGRLPVIQLAAIFGAGAVVSAGLVAVERYRFARFLAFLDPWKDPLGGGYQIIQATYAFGSGRFFGVGLGMSRQKFFYLPAAHTDFIFAIIGEELGLAGTLAVVAAFGVFACAGLLIAMRCRDPFGKVLAGGLTATIVVQAVMNMAAVTGLMPVTGIPLPLVSAGGSSITFTMMCVGMVLSVSRYGARGPVPVKAVRHEAEGGKRAVSGERRRDGWTRPPRAVGGSGADRRRA